MKNYQRKFLQLATNQQATLSASALRFGHFTLKSGRQSPYFFQSGTFSNGEALRQIGAFFADTIMHQNIAFDSLFGPAYKGIPLVSATAVALAENYDLSKPWSFNRKITKEHGEGGLVVGAQLHGKILLIDDVLTAGTAIRESIQLIQSNSRDTKICGVVTLLDRCEIVQNNKSAKTLIQEQYDIPVCSVVSIYDVIEFLRETQGTDDIVAIEQHLQQYGEKSRMDDSAIGQHSRPRDKEMAYGLV